MTDSERVECVVCRAELQRKIERSRRKQQELEEELRRWRESLLKYIQQVRSQSRDTGHVIPRDVT